jgi:hypothetical protein
MARAAIAAPTEKVSGVHFLLLPAGSGRSGLPPEDGAVVAAGGAGARGHLVEVALREPSVAKSST